MNKKIVLGVVEIKKVGIMIFFVVVGLLVAASLASAYSTTSQLNISVWNQSFEIFFEGGAEVFSCGVFENHTFDAVLVRDMNFSNETVYISNCSEFTIDYDRLICDVNMSLSDEIRTLVVNETNTIKWFVDAKLVPSQVMFDTMKTELENEIKTTTDSKNYFERETFRFRSELNFTQGLLHIERRENDRLKYMFLALIIIIVVSVILLIKPWPEWVRGVVGGGITKKFVAVKKKGKGEDK